MENKSIQHHVASISDLPPEMLEKILKNIDTSNLLSNRTVNRQWNELSSRIMRIRDDTTLHFALSDGNYIKHFQHIRCEKCSLNLCSSISTSDAKRLTDLVLCLNESSLFPFTSFRFDGMSMGSWDSLMTFLTIWGRNIQQLRVCMSGSKNKIEILLMSLLEKVPNLTTLAFIHYSRFPCSVSLPADTQRQFRLPNLEVLYVYYPSGIYGSIFEKILTAAPNLKKFYKTLSPEDFEMLHRSEKFHCLKDLKIEITKDLIDYWKKSPNHFDLQLRSLTLSLNDDIYMDQQLKFDASIIINQLLQSNGNNLRTLSTQPLEPLKGLVLPKFGNLRLLRCQRTLNHGNYKMLPQTWTVFPNMKELDVEPFRGAYSKIFDESLKTLPSVATLRISLNSNSDGLDDLIKRTPNVKTMSIAVSLKHDDSLDYSNVFSPLPTVNYKNISIYLPNLENLRWHFFFEEHKVDYQLDALITGLPPHLCYALAKELRYIDHLPEDEVPNYWEPCNPSLLDLKELKTLHFVLEKSSPYSSYGRKSTKKDKALDSAGFGPESIFYQTGITKISKLLVFDRMPNLKVVVHKVES